MFTVLDRILFRAPEGVRAPDEVHRLYQLSRSKTQPGADEFDNLFSAPNLNGLHEAVSGVAQIAGFIATPLRVTGVAADTTSVHVTSVTKDYFTLLGITPQRGRFFAADEMQYGDARYVAVLSDAIWRRRFGADSAILGRTVHLANRRDTAAYTVIGIAAPGFAGVDVDADDLWVPYTARGAASEGGGAWWRERGLRVVSVLVRVPATTDTRAVEPRLTAALRRVNAGTGWFDPNTRAVVAPLAEARGPRFGAARPRELTLATRLAGMSLVVLVLAIANAAALMLMRSLARQRETAVRVALGVSRARIASRLAVECAVVTALAASAATLLAYWTGGILRPLLFSSVHWPHRLIDHRVILLVTGTTMVASIAASIAPLVLATRTDVMAALKAGGQGAGNPAPRLRSTFLAAQTAICVALLAAAGLFIQSLHRATSMDLTVDEVVANAPVAMINRAMAQKYWPGQSAVGECLGVMGTPCRRIVGVFDDVRYDVAAVPGPYYVLPITAAPRGAQPALLLRYSREVTDDDVARVHAAVVSLVGPTRAQLLFARVSARVDRQVRPWRIAASLLSLFGLVGLASAGVAGGVPAIRATRINPVVALQAD